MAIAPMPGPRRSRDRWLWLIGRALLVGIVLVSIILIILNRTAPELVARWRGSALDTAKPVLTVVSVPVHWGSVGVDKIRDFFTTHRRAKALDEENRRLRALAERNDALLAENAQLRRQLGLSTPATKSRRVVRVVGASSGAYVQGAMIAAGFADGVMVGDPVRDEQGLVGRVIERGRGAARVLLITDAASRVPVRIARTGQTAMIEGRNQPLVDLVFLPPGADVQPGDRIVTSGHGGLFAPDIPVGEVVSTAGSVPRVQPIAGLDRLAFVIVLAPYFPPAAVLPASPPPALIDPNAPADPVQP
jgi:rod shape-determining protein MreC